jgi:hypothetical protein
VSIYGALKWVEPHDCEGSRMLSSLNKIPAVAFTPRRFKGSEAHSTHQQSSWHQLPPEKLATEIVDACGREHANFYPILWPQTFSKSTHPSCPRTQLPPIPRWRSSYSFSIKPPTPMRSSFLAASFFAVLSPSLLTDSVVAFLHGGSPFKVWQPDSFRIRLNRRSTFNYSRDILDRHCHYRT